MSRKSTGSCPVWPMNSVQKWSKHLHLLRFCCLSLAAPGEKTGLPWLQHWRTCAWNSRASKSPRGGNDEGWEQHTSPTNCSFQGCWSCGSAWSLWDCWQLEWDFLEQIPIEQCLPKCCLQPSSARLLDLYSGWNLLLLRWLMWRHVWVRRVSWFYRTSRKRSHQMHILSTFSHDGTPWLSL